MDNGRFHIAPWRKAGSWILSLPGRVLSGSSVAALSPQIASGARKHNRQEDDQNGKDREKNDRESNDKDEKRDDGGKSDQDSKKDSGTQAERQNTDDKDARRERRDERASDQDNVNDESADGGRRSVERRQEADAEASDDGDNSRRTRDLEQRRNRDDEPADDEPADEPTTPAPVVPSNPNVPADTTTGVPDLTDAELIVQGNEDVIASVSAEGGFAFARSGNVIAISGPDGAQIIQADEATTDTGVTPPPDRDDEPSDDGGNNDMDFTS